MPEYHCKGFENGMDFETISHRSLVELCGLNPTGLIACLKGKKKPSPWDLNKTEFRNIQNVQSITPNYLTYEESGKFQLTWGKAIKRHQCQDNTNSTI